MAFYFEPYSFCVTLCTSRSVEIVMGDVREPNALCTNEIACSFLFFFFTDPVLCSRLIDAHPQSQITGLAWLDNNTIVSVGQDCNSRYWDIRNFP